jgi:primosomal protein N' (replication factor Y) (superfamily II helicase)
LIKRKINQDEKLYKELTLKTLLVLNPAMENNTLFADILLPLPLPGFFTYRVPEALRNDIQPGIRVVVPFGSRKIYSGLVRRVHHTPPAKYDAKYLHSVLDEVPVVNEKQFLFWEWLAEYYLAHPGDVMNAALPPAMKMASETKITLNPDFDPGEFALNDREYLIVEALEIQKTLSISDVSKITSQAKVFSLLSNMMDKRIILLQEELENPYRPRLEKFIRLSESYSSEEKLKEAFDNAEKKAPKQLELLIEYIKLSGRYHTKTKEVPVKDVTVRIKNACSAGKRHTGNLHPYYQQI